VITVSIDTHSETEDFFRVIGTPKYRYYVQPTEVKSMLSAYFRKISLLPVYVIFSTYHDFEDIEVLLKKLRQPYDIQRLADTCTVMIDGKTVRYHVPLFRMQVDCINALQEIIVQTFWLAESNCSYIISFSNNVRVTTQITKSMRNKHVETSILQIDMNVPATTMCMAHDADGFYLFSNEETYSSVEKVYNHFAD
jgi:hypothetical protein